MGFSIKLMVNSILLKSNDNFSEDVIMPMPIGDLTSI